ncbi:D-2-hydroxyacid dehydrogenase [Paraburkholderia diazotrophica]|uniref:Glycerate dehydrogenase n=1 Tax=Paraburkholderia diazotrophica TaxID=667676 RepID=A0A1H6YK56_9BURK|nr:D-2-hydroxyacid dehydrogenase [Paraburkholderia diazotrophica]SEJ39347.1 glycerate dehydrogenase [Paraburkholderia diazotrophica]
MQHDIVFLDRSTLNADVRRPTFAHRWVQYASTSEHEVAQRLEGATIAITNKVPLRADMLDRHPSIRMIAVAATGYDCVDTAYCRERGIAVANIRGYATQTVPEHTFALILALRRNLLAYRSDVQRGRWQTAKQFCFFDHPIRDLHGSTLGIIGGGALGQGTAEIARGFGMRVIFAAHDSKRARTPGLDYVPLDTLLRTSDVISLHTPLTPITRNLIGLDELRIMKRDCLLINTARGGLVCEASLATALKEGLIAGAGFDVLSQEPPVAGNPLLELDLPNFILTPHVAWASDDAMQSLADQLIENIEAFARGEPRNLVI